MANSKETVQEDVAELRRNLATGNQKDSSNASSASKFSVMNLGTRFMNSAQFLPSFVTVSHQ